MKIHLIKKQTIEDYVEKNARSKASFEIWFSILKRAVWKEANEIISTLIAQIYWEEVQIE